VAHDGRTPSAELSDAAIDGLRWAGCDVVDLGAATAPCLARAACAGAADGFALATALSDEPQEVGFSFWRHAGEPLSGAGLEPIERLFHSSAPRRRRSSGGYRRVVPAREYLSQFSDYYHALRPLRVVNKTHSLAWRGFVEQLTANVAVDVDWINGGSPGIERVAARVHTTQAHFGMRIDALGESCQVVDERGDVLSIDALLALLHAEMRATDQYVVSRRILEPALRQSTWQSLREIDNAVAADSEGRIWFTTPLPCPDALKTLSLLLTLLSRSDRPLSELARSAIL
jgi:phosphomannomutase